MNFNHFLNRIADINLSLDQKKRLYDVIKDIIKDNNDESSINEDTIIQIVKDNIEEIIPNNEFKLTTKIVGNYNNNNPNGRILKTSGELYNKIDITVGTEIYSFKITNIINNHDDDNYYNAEYYYIGNIRLHQKEQRYLPLLTQLEYSLGKKSGIYISLYNTNVFYGYTNRKDTKKTFNIYDETAKKLIDKEFNILYDNGFIFIDDRDSPNLYNCGVYILNPKFINNIPTGIK